MHRGCEVHLSTDVVTGDPVLRVVGEVDVSTASVLADALHGVTPDERHKLVVDLASVGFMSAAGLRLLLDANTRLRSTGHSLLLRHPSSAVSTVLSAAGVEHLFEIERGDSVGSPGR